MNAAYTPRALAGAIADVNERREAVATKLAEALAIVNARRAAMAIDGFDGAGRFSSANHHGLLILGNEFWVPGWKVLARIPSGTSRLETAPGFRAKKCKGGLAVMFKPTKTCATVLAESLDWMTANEIADAIDKHAPRPFKTLEARATTTRRGSL